MLLTLIKERKRPVNNLSLAETVTAAEIQAPCTGVRGCQSHVFPASLPSIPELELRFLLFFFWRSCHCCCGCWLGGWAYGPVGFSLFYVVMHPVYVYICCVLRSTLPPNNVETDIVRRWDNGSGGFNLDRASGKCACNDIYSLLKADISSRSAWISRFQLLGEILQHPLLN